MLAVTITAACGSYRVPSCSFFSMSQVLKTRLKHHQLKARQFIITNYFNTIRMKATKLLGLCILLN